MLITIEKKRLLVDPISGRCVGMDVKLFNRRLLPAVKTRVWVTVFDVKKRKVAKGGVVGTLARRADTWARIEFDRPLKAGRYRFVVEVQWPTMGGDDAARAAGPNQAKADFWGVVK